LTQEQIMKSRIIAIVVAGLIANSAFAGDFTSGSERKTNKEEGIGLGAGAAIGAIAGGPVGFVIGAALGGWTGDRFHREKTAKLDAQARSEEAEQLASSLQAALKGSESENRQLRIVMLDQEEAYRQAIERALDVEIYFHTGESTLDAAVQDRVRQLGEIIRDFDEVAVVVDGYADPRGDEGYNQQLSAERAAAVRDTLIEAGVPANRIVATAKGEQDSQAVDGDLDAMALERKVNLTIVTSSPRENRVAQQR
jgi:outer membrane protein OmpA-like peptidoglycan-associated protein